MPRSKEEVQALLSDIAKGYRGKEAGVIYPDEQPIQGVNQEIQGGQLPPPGPGLMKDPNINYDNLAPAKQMIGRIDSPEYKAAEGELGQVSGMLRAFPNDPRAKDWGSQVSAKKAALERIRSGK